MAEDIRPIIVKRIKKNAGGHHGGAWKIAYADFVTAMMAFFLLMWLLGSTAKGDLEGIETYFKTPLKVAMMGGSAVGSNAVILKGGGKDLTKQTGQVKNGDKEPDKVIDLKEVKAALEEEEKGRLQELKKKIEAAIEASPMLKQFKNQLLLDITSEGLRIQIVDEQNRAMFGLASPTLQPYAKQILHEIGGMLNDVPNKISLSGHTDATGYGNAGKGYSNWELSSDRANASRRELISGGLNEAKMLRVVGLSSAVPFDRNDPLNPINRRISIIIMNKQAEENAINDDSPVNVSSDGDQAEIESAIKAKKVAPTGISPAK